MLFKYKGIAQSGAQVNGIIDSSSKELAISELKQQQVLIISIAEAAPGSSLFTKQSKPTYKDFEFITSELSLLLDNGVKIDKALSILAKAKVGSSAGFVVEAISAKINQGSSLAAAFAEFPDYFDGLYVNLIKIGEETATLPEVFSGLAINMKFKVALQQKIMQALTYPLVILSVCLLAIFFIFNFVVPNMAVMFREQEHLPFYTALILAISDWLVAYQHLLFIGVAIAITALYLNWQNPKFKKSRENLLADLPIIKSLFVQTERIKFCSGVLLMLKAGIKIDNAVALACGNVKSSLLQKEINFSLKEIKQGQPIAKALSSSSLFPDFYLSLIEVGEQSGKLDTVFNEITTRSRTEFDLSVSRLINIIEPLLILVMGGIVGSVVVTMMLSITSVNDIGL
ncbi:MAG: secretion system protein [Gammaproteobacteria bacterium]|nr:MAG: secretion system protein [Gammaproteobacteria bacterium]